jgi:putative lipoic acid-binding regulatory protein
MKRFSEQLHKKSESISLRVDEKNSLRERLVSYMEYHPLPIDKKVSKPTSTPTLTDPVVRVINLSSLKFLQWSGLTAAILLLVVPYVAERAVPGDMLYAVKVNFNEEVRSTLALNSYDKVVWETERLNRRIAEARLLASEGKMTEELENSVAEAVRVHSENAKKEIEELKQTDEGEAVLASIQLDTTISVQSSALRSDMQASSTDSVMAVRIVGVLDSSQENNVAMDPGNVLPSRERLVGQVETETTRAYELLNSIENYATVAERSDIKRRLEDVGRKTEVALQTFESSEDEARKKMLDILQDTHKLIVFMTNIDVRTSLTVDEIVPVTLTQEERLNAVNQQIQDIFSLIERIEVALVATSSVAVEEKIRQAIEESKNELEGKIVPSIKSNDFDLLNVENRVRSIYDVVLDSRSLLGVRDSELDALMEDSNTATSTDSLPLDSSTSSTSTTTEVKSE